MTVEDAILEKVRALPPEKQQEVLEFAGSLNEEEIAELRWEMWKNFPREDI